MAVPRSLSFLRRGTGLQALEVYLDPLCPFSAKIARSLQTNVLPLTEKGGKYDDKLSVVVRLYPQPFHYLATFHTEAVIVFGQTYPDLFWAYLLAVCSKLYLTKSDGCDVFDTQNEYFNQPAASLTIPETRDKLIHLAIDVLEKNGKAGNGPKSKLFGELRDKLENKGSPNGGNEATDGLKHNLKIGRQNGIHVTPTALFDGLKEDAVSSSWGKEEWEKFLSDKFSS